MVGNDNGGSWSWSLCAEQGIILHENKKGILHSLFSTRDGGLDDLKKVVAVFFIRATVDCMVVSLASTTQLHTSLEQHQDVERRTGNLHGKLQETQAQRML